MKLKNIFVIGPFLALLSFTVGSQSDVRPMMIQSIDAMAFIIGQQYAPKQWKKEFISWDLKSEVKKAKNKILGTENLTVKDYHIVLKDLFYSMQDYHTGVYFYATELATLPFVVRSAQGRYFIVWIDREKFSKQAFPFSVGDEIVTFNERPIQEEIDLILSEIGANTIPTQKALAAQYLTSRRAFTGMVVPKGTVTLGILKKGEKEVQSFQTAWAYYEEKINFDAFSLTRNVAVTQRTRGKKIIEKLSAPLMVRSQFLAEQKLFKDFTNSFSDNYEKIADQQENPYRLGKKDSFLPEMGDVLWHSNEDDLFQAYIFKQGNYRIGHIRLPSYMPKLPKKEEDKKEEDKKEEDGDFLNFLEKSALAFQSVIQYFEKDTDMLIIDQHHNPGGSVFYLYALASTLSKKSLRPPLHHISITPQDVLEAQEFLKVLKTIKSDKDIQELFDGRTTLGGMPLNMSFARMLREYFRFILDQWSEKKTLTDLTHLWGFDHIPPHPKGVYTKPILILTDELSFSGGDFFPAILQDNKRATIMGTRTAGAGGYVTGFSIPNILGIHFFSLTGSLAKRLDSNPLENLGVIPDIPYTMTVEDYQNDYASYKKAILDTVKKMLNNKD